MFLHLGLRGEPQAAVGRPRLRRGGGTHCAAKRPGIRSPGVQVPCGGGARTGTPQFTGRPTPTLKAVIILERND